MTIMRVTIVRMTIVRMTIVRVTIVRMTIVRVAIVRMTIVRMTIAMFIAAMAAAASINSDAVAITAITAGSCAIHFIASFMSPSASAAFSSALASDPGGVFASTSYFDDFGDITARVAIEVKVGETVPTIELVELDYEEETDIVVYVGEADVDPPVITLLGNATVEVRLLSQYQDAGASAMDLLDGSVLVDVAGLEAITTEAVTPAEAPFVLTYSAVDAAGNEAAPVLRSVAVVDPCTPPAFFCWDLGICSVCPSGNSSGVTDECICMNTWYEALQEVAVEVEEFVPVDDIIPPVITLLGGGQLGLNSQGEVFMAHVVAQYDEFVCPPALAWDEVDGDLTDAVMQYGTVDTAILTPNDAPHIITYDARDSAGNAATPTRRRVYIVSPCPDGWHMCSEERQCVESILECPLGKSAESEHTLQPNTTPELCEDDVCTTTPCDVRASLIEAPDSAPPEVGLLTASSASTGDSGAPPEVSAASSGTIRTLRTSYGEPAPGGLLLRCSSWEELMTMVAPPNGDPEVGHDGAEATCLAAARDEVDGDVTSGLNVEQVFDSPVCGSREEGGVVAGCISGGSCPAEALREGQCAPGVYEYAWHVADRDGNEARVREMVEVVERATVAIQDGRTRREAPSSRGYKLADCSPVNRRPPNIDLRLQLLKVLYVAELRNHLHVNFEIRRASARVALRALLSTRTRQVHLLWTAHALGTFVLALYSMWLKDRLELGATYDWLEDPYYPANFLLVKRAAEDSVAGGLVEEDGVAGGLVEAAAHELAAEASPEPGVVQEDLRWPLPKDFRGEIELGTVRVEEEEEQEEGPGARGHVLVVSAVVHVATSSASSQSKTTDGRRLFTLPSPPPHAPSATAESSVSAPVGDGEESAPSAVMDKSASIAAAVEAGTTGSGEGTLSGYLEAAAEELSVPGLPTESVGLSEDPQLEQSTATVDEAAAAWASLLGEVARVHQAKATAAAQLAEVEADKAILRGSAHVQGLDNQAEEVWAARRGESRRQFDELHQGLSTALENAEEIAQRQAEIAELAVNLTAAAEALFLSTLESAVSLTPLALRSARALCTSNRDSSGDAEFVMQQPGAPPPPSAGRHHEHRQRRRLQARGGAGASTATEDVAEDATTADTEVLLGSDQQNLQATEWRPMRYVGLEGRNRVLGGMTLMQYRRAPPEASERPCTARFHTLEAPCFTRAAGNERPYGSDPVFRRSSHMYRSDLSAGTYYNLSRAGYSDGDARSHALYPFEGLDLGGFREGGYPFYFDAGVTGARGLQLADFLYHGLYMDERTAGVQVRMLTWNPEYHCLTTIRLEFLRPVGSGTFRLLTYTTPISFLDLKDGAATLAPWGPRVPLWRWNAPGGVAAAGGIAGRGACGKRGKRGTHSRRGTEGLGGMLRDVDALEFHLVFIDWMSMVSVVLLALQIVLETGYLPRFKGFVGMLEKCGMDLAHFFGVLTYLGLVVAVLNHVLYGPQVNTASTLQGCVNNLATTFAGNVNSAVVKEMRRVQKSGQPTLLALVLDQFISLVVPVITVVVLLSMLLALVGDASVEQIKESRRTRMKVSVIGQMLLAHFEPYFLRGRRPFHFNTYIKECMIAQERAMASQERAKALEIIIHEEKEYVREVTPVSPAVGGGDGEGQLEVPGAGPVTEAFRRAGPLNILMSNEPVSKHNELSGGKLNRKSGWMYDSWVLQSVFSRLMSHENVVTRGCSAESEEVTEDLYHLAKTVASDMLLVDGMKGTHPGEHPHLLGRESPN
eukprot:gene607-1034_t